MKRSDVLLCSLVPFTFFVVVACVAISVNGPALASDLIAPSGSFSTPTGGVSFNSGLATTRWHETKTLAERLSRSTSILAGGREVMVFHDDGTALLNGSEIVTERTLAGRLALPSAVSAMLGTWLALALVALKRRIRNALWLRSQKGRSGPGGAYRDIDAANGGAR